MTARAPQQPDFWTRIMLRVWTRPWLPGLDQPPEDCDAVARAVSAGWLFRSASPRWDAVLRPYAADLAASRIVVVPELLGPDRAADLLMLLRDRCRAAGLDTPPPEPAALCAAEARLYAALAPGWLGRGAALDITDRTRP